MAFLLVTFSWLFRGFSVTFWWPSSVYKNSVWAFFVAFSWLFRFGQNLRVLALEQSSEQKKQRFWTIFLYAPSPPPLKSKNCIFIVVSPSLKLGQALHCLPPKPVYSQGCEGQGPAPIQLLCFMSRICDANIPFALEGALLPCACPAFGRDENAQRLECEICLILYIFSFVLLRLL